MITTLTPYTGQYEQMLKLQNCGVVNELKKLLEAKYTIVLKLKNTKHNLYINNMPCFVRNSKYAKIKISDNCKIIEGEDVGSGGTNTYPHISFIGGEAIVEVVTNGFPVITSLFYEYEYEILDICKIIEGCEYERIYTGN